MRCSGSIRLQRLDLPGMDDGGVETCFNCLMEEHRVEDAPGGGIEPERDVGHTEHGPHPGQLGLDLPDGVESDHRVSAQVVVTGGEREGEGIEDQVLGPKPVALDGEIVDAMGHPQLPLQRSSLTLLVDEQADGTGAVLASEAEHPIEP